jgi:hypothetical protein
MKIPWSSLRPSKVPFYEIISGNEVVSGAFDCTSRSGSQTTFARSHSPSRWWTSLVPTMPYCEWPCFVKFKVVPNYTYLKMKMPGPNEVITVEGSFEQAYYCDQDCVAQAVIVLASHGPASSDRNAREVLAKEKAKVMASLDLPSSNEAPDTTSGHDGSAGPPSRCSLPRRG